MLFLNNYVNWDVDVLINGAHGLLEDIGTCFSWALGIFFIFKGFDILLTIVDHFFD